MNKTSNRWSWVDTLIVLIGLLPIAAAVLLYDKLPDLLAVHFGIDGTANGFQGKLSFLLTISAVIMGVPLLMKVFRGIDPKTQNYEKFHGFYEMFRLLLTVLLGGVLAMTLAYNLGYIVNIQMFVMLAIGVLWIIMGNYMARIRFNYFMGIRNAWTLANEEVWRKTHRMSGPLWMVSGLLILIGAFLPGIAAGWLLGIAIAVAIVIPTVYSYLAFRNLMR